MQLFTKLVVKGTNVTNITIQYILLERIIDVDVVVVVFCHLDCT